MSSVNVYPQPDPSMYERWPSSSLGVISWRITFANLRSEEWSFVARFAALKCNEASSKEADCFRGGVDIIDHRERPGYQHN